MPPRTALGAAGGCPWRRPWRRAAVLRPHRRFHGLHLARARVSLAPAAYAAGGRGLLLHVDHYYRDVVVAAGVEGCGEEAACRPLGIFRRIERNLRDPRLGDHV